MHGWLPLENTHGDWTFHGRRTVPDQTWPLIRTLEGLILGTTLAWPRR